MTSHDRARVTSKMTSTCDTSTTLPLFLLKVRQHVPEVMEDLSHVVLPKWKAWLKGKAPWEEVAKAIVAGLSSYHLVKGADVEIDPRCFDELEEACHSGGQNEHEVKLTYLAFILKATEYKARLYGIVIATLSSWMSSSKKHKNKEWVFPFPADMMFRLHSDDLFEVVESENDLKPTDERFFFGSPGAYLREHLGEVKELRCKVPVYDPSQESRTAAKSKIKNVLEEHLEAYLDEQEEYVKNLGLDYQQKRTQDLYFDWLALYQVKRLSALQIAEKFPSIDIEKGSRRTTISNGYKEAARAMLGPLYTVWLRRPTKGGRPRKSK